jgi:hypothetical protein
MMAAHQQINTRHCTPVHGGASVMPKARAPVLENASRKAVATSTKSGVLSRPEFMDASVLGCVSGFGLDGWSGNARRTSLRVFSTSSPPVLLKNNARGFQSRKGAETMTATPASLCAAHALARHVPDMAHGFTISTGYGQINIPPGPTAKRITALVQKMLTAELASAAKAAQTGGAA